VDRLAYSCSYDRQHNVRPRRNIRMALQHGVQHTRTQRYHMHGTHSTKYIVEYFEMDQTEPYKCVKKLVDKAIKATIRKAKARDRTRKWHENNKSYSISSQRDYRKQNSHALSTKASIRHDKERATRLEQMKIYRETDSSREKRSNNSKKRRATDPLFRLAERARSAINNMKARGKGSKKDTDKTFKLIGKSVDELHSHLLNQLRPEDNRKIKLYQVDHIFPIASFANTAEPTQRAMHYSNLQLLTAEENLDKRAKLPTKAMAARVDPSSWPTGITLEMLPERYDGWATSLRMKCL
jgi:hypothetical protein